MLAHLSGTICLKHSATLMLPPLLKPPSRGTCLIIISKLFFTALPIPSSDAECVCLCVCVCVCVCVSVSVVSVIVKRPVLPPCAVDGRSRNPLYYCYYYYYYPCTCQPYCSEARKAFCKQSMSPNLEPVCGGLCTTCTGKMSISLCLIFVDDLFPFFHYNRDLP